MKVNVFHGGIVSIGTEKKLPLAGFRRNKALAQSGEVGLEANWVMIGTKDGLILLISIDALFSSTFFETEILRNLEIEYQLLIKSCVVVASHTHTAPALDPNKPILGKSDSHYIKEMALRIAIAIGEEYSRGRGNLLTSWQHGSKKLEQSIFRRAKRFRLSYKSWPIARISMQIAPNSRVKIDQEIKIWIAINDEGKPAFCIVSWPCHATSRSNVKVASPDFIGVIRDAFREQLNNRIPIIYMPGASGDIRPITKSQYSLKRLFYPYPFQKSFIRPNAEQQQMFDRALKSAIADLFYEQNFASVSGKSSYSDTHFPLARIMEGDAKGKVQILCLQLAGLEIYGVSAEISHLWLNLLGFRGDSKHQILTGCVGDVFGYLPSDSQVPEGGYEVEYFRKAFGVKAKYTSNISIKAIIHQAFDKVRINK